MVSTSKIIDLKPYINIRKSANKHNAVLQYFFSDINSILPIRDVNNTCHHGVITEPHLEIGAENFIKTQAQSKIVKAMKSGIEYIFLVTKCQNKELKEFYDKQFIIGYIKIQNAIRRAGDKGKNFWAVRGSSKIVDYEHAINIPELFGKNLSRQDLNKKLSREQTQNFVEYFQKQDDITQSWIDEINKIDSHKKTCLGTGCEFLDLCKRKNILN